MIDARSELRKVIAAIVPVDATEEADIADTLAWIDSSAPLWRTAKPATPPKHLVSYFLLVDGEHVLLVDHINAELWLPTGGHVEPREHPWATVRREAHEELGIECGSEPSQPLFLTVSQTVGRTVGHTDVSLWYVLRGDRSAALSWDAGEFQSVTWFHKDRIPTNRSDPNMARFLGKLVLQKRVEALHQSGLTHSELRGF